MFPKGIWNHRPILTQSPRPETKLVSSSRWPLGFPASSKPPELTCSSKWVRNPTPENRRKPPQTAPKSAAKPAENRPQTRRKPPASAAAGSWSLSSHSASGAKAQLAYLARSWRGNFRQNQGPCVCVFLSFCFGGGEACPWLIQGYCGWTKSCTTVKPWLKPWWVGICRGIDSFQGF